ncbi:FecR family protein [Parapedobacter deserti]|uniref:FecR family protein n=1 Tax=Parapedobacter deserti TaxID=1912957 RepID=A0ABV7JGE8_9SPHI
MMGEKDYRKLFEKYLNGDYTAEELKEILAFFQVERSGNTLEQLVEDYLANDAVVSQTDEDSVRRVVHQTDQAIHAALQARRQRRRFQLSYWPYVAASILIVLSVSFGIYRYYGAPATQPALVSDHTGDIPPGGNRATLTLSDGRTIVLDGARGEIVIGNEVTYTDGSRVISNPSLSLQLTTPKGGTYQVTLPDSSKVWLNASSTLTYPNNFNGHERTVYLEGEAYFAVRGLTSSVGPHKELHKVPFKVVSKGHSVEVKGTEFNVSAYADEAAVMTTLVEGQVSVLADGSTTTLTAGQQSVSTGGTMHVHAVNPVLFTAWKDGMFIFEDETLENIMQRVARWYDVEIEYQGVNKEELYTGSFSRYENVSGVLNNLAFAGDLTYTIKERRIIISKAD